jgi:hypothetical protein
MSHYCNEMIFHDGLVGLFAARHERENAAFANKMAAMAETLDRQRRMIEDFHQEQDARSRHLMENLSRRDEASFHKPLFPY